MVDLADPEVRFLVMPPYLFFPDYVVDLDDAIAKKVHLERAEDCLLLGHRHPRRPSRGRHRQPARPDRREPPDPGGHAGRARRVRLQHPHAPSSAAA